jgi:hypothetical protein
MKISLRDIEKDIYQNMWRSLKSYHSICKEIEKIDSSIVKAELGEDISNLIERRKILIDLTKTGTHQNYISYLKLIATYKKENGNTDSGGIQAPLPLYLPFLEDNEQELTR